MKKENLFFYVRATFFALTILVASMFVSRASAAGIEPLKLNPARVSGAKDFHLLTWKSIVGVISAPGKINPVGNIKSGTFPWSVRSGRAQVNTISGDFSFQVKGLVINGQIFSGTPGPVSAVTGTLVCSPGDASQTVFDTPAVPLNKLGNAQFKGQVQNMTSPCNSPVFLIRIAIPEGAAGFWIATGAERSID